METIIRRKKRHKLDMLGRKRALCSTKCRQTQAYEALHLIISACSVTLFSQSAPLFFYKQPLLNYRLHQIKSNSYVHYSFPDMTPYRQCENTAKSKIYRIKKSEVGVLFFDRTCFPSLCCSNVPQTACICPQFWQPSGATPEHYCTILRPCLIAVRNNSAGHIGCLSAAFYEIFLKLVGI